MFTVSEILAAAPPGSTVTIVAKDGTEVRVVLPLAEKVEKVEKVEKKSRRLFGKDREQRRDSYIAEFCRREPMTREDARRLMAEMGYQSAAAFGGFLTAGILRAREDGLIESTGEVFPVAVTIDNCRT